MMPPILFLRKTRYFCELKQNFYTPKKPYTIMTISIFTLTSTLHDEAAIKASTQEFLSTLQFDFKFCDSDYSTYGEADLNLIYVRTGGTEGVFKSLQAQLMAQSSRPFYLLTSGKSNSLAASMEILSYLRLNKLKAKSFMATLPTSIRA